MDCLTQNRSLDYIQIWPRFAFTRVHGDKCVTSSTCENPVLENGVIQQSVSFVGCAQDDYTWIRLDDVGKQLHKALDLQSWCHGGAWSCALLLHRHFISCKEIGWKEDSGWSLGAHPSFKTLLVVCMYDLNSSHTCSEYMWNLIPQALVRTLSDIGPTFSLYQLNGNEIIAIILANKIWPSSVLSPWRRPKHLGQYVAIIHCCSSWYREKVDPARPSQLWNSLSSSVIVFIMHRGLIVQQCGGIFNLCPLPYKLLCLPLLHVMVCVYFLSWDMFNLVWHLNFIAWSY